jgi:hypothetical protein
MSGRKDKIMNALGGFDSMREAQQRARHIAHIRQEMRYVVYESGSYFVATEEDLDTFFMGSKPLYCTADEN